MTALYIGLVFYAFVFPSVCAYALVRGGASERQVAIAYLIAAAVGMLGTAFGTHWRGPNWNVIASDVAFLVALVVIARRSTRFWPIWAAASQLAGVLAHIPVIVNPDLPKQLYVSTQPFWAFPLLGSLLLGTVWFDRERREGRMSA